MEWDTKQLWCQQLERRIYELGALVKGQIPIQADRLADVVEQVDALRKELEVVSTKLDKVADYVRANVVKKNGGVT